MTSPLPVLLVAAALAGERTRIDFGATDGGLVPGGDIADTWAWGEIQSGPGAGATGPRGWATVLDGSYYNDAIETLTLPSFDLSDAARPVLGLHHWYAIDEAGFGDVGRLEVWTAAGWVPVEPTYGYPAPGGFQGAGPGWHDTWFDLGTLGPAPTLRLVLDTDLSLTAAGWYLGELILFDGDPVPPHIEILEAPADTQVLRVGYRVEATVEDDLQPCTAELRWSDSAGGSGTEPLLQEGATWSARIPVREPGVTVTWQVAASDGDNETVTDPATFDVFLAPPTDLGGPTAPVAASSAPLHWTPPDSPYGVTAYEVLRDGALVATVEAPEAEAPLADGRVQFTVRARFNTPIGPRTGDESLPWTVDAALPTIDGVQPDQAWPGDRLRVTLTGANLLLAQGFTTLEVGADTSVESLDVRDVNTVIAELSLSEGAAAGPRSVVLRTGDDVVRAPDAFEVLDAGGRPAIDSVAPSRLERGGWVDLRIALSGADILPGEPELWLGPGVVVESVTRSGGRLDARVAIADDAPLGARPVELDDGVRLLLGPDIEVVRPAPAVQRSGCTVARSRSSLGGVLLGITALLGRRSGRPAHASAAPVARRRRRGWVW